MIPQSFLNTIAIEHHVSSAELEALSLAMQGESIANIAQQLHIKEDAVRKRLSEVYQKFQIQGRGPVKLTKLQRHLINQYREKANLQDAFVDSYNQAISSSQSEEAANHYTYIDWDAAPDVSVFYNRTDELATLNDWIVNQRCRLVAVLGMGGIGKTSLTVKLARQIQEQFDYLIWRSLLSAPSLEELLADLAQILQPEVQLGQFKTLERRIFWLISQLQARRCLLVFDGVEAILSAGKLAGTYLPGYQNYGQLFHRLAEEPSKSCILLTSREKVGTVALLEGATSPVRSLKLRGLGEHARSLLQEKGLCGEQDWTTLIEKYRGNPLMLKLAATTVQEVFDGDVGEFLTTTLFPHSVTDFVAQMVKRLSVLESKVIVEIANQELPIKLQQLITNLAEVSTQDIIDAVVSLKQRSLIEKVDSGFILLPAVREIIPQVASSE